MNEAQQPNDLPRYAKGHITTKAHQLVKRLGLPKTDFDDLASELTLDLWQRLPKYDPSKCSLNTFCARIIDRKVANLIRHHTAEMRDCRRQTFSVEGGETDGDDAVVQDKSEALDEDAHDLRLGRRNITREDERDLRLDLAQVLGALPEALRTIAGRLMSERKADVIRDLRVANSTFHDRYVVPLRQAFERAGMEVYL